jgi:hypothetical protein
MSAPTDPNLQSVDPMPEHSDSGSGRSIRASSCHLGDTYFNLKLLVRIKSTSAIHTNYAL